MTDMPEPTQAERIAALKARRAANGAAAPKSVIAEPTPLQPPAIPTFADPSSQAMTAAHISGPGLRIQDPAPIAPVATVRESRITSVRLPRPAPQRVAAAGASIVSFVAMTVAMGPLTRQAVETAAADVPPETVPGTDVATSIAPPAAPEVFVEVIPNYVAVSPDGTPLPGVSVLPDGTLAGAKTGETSLAADALERTATALDGSTAAAPSTARAAVPATAAPAPIAAPTAAPKTTAAPATVAPAQPPPTAAPTAAPPTTAPSSAPAPTAAPTTAAPPPPPTTVPPATAPPPPKSDASG